MKKAKFLQSSEWKQLRSAILQRDNNKCVLCGNDDKICVHHILYRRGYDEFKLEPLNLICLCPSCHWKIHKLCHNFILLQWLRYNRPKQYQFVIENV